MVDDTGDVTVVTDGFSGWERSTSRHALAATGLVVGEAWDETESSLSVYQLGAVLVPMPADVGLGDLRLDSECEARPHSFTVSDDGSTIAWVELGAIRGRNHGIDVRLATLPADVGTIDSIDLRGSDIVVDRYGQVPLLFHDGAWSQLSGSSATL